MTNSYTFTSTSTGYFSGVPTANKAYVTSFTNTGNSWFNSGRLGIGTTSPFALLSIQATSTPGAFPLFGVATTSGTATTSQNTAFIITSTGKVGIATTSPTNDLSLNGTELVSSSATGTIKVESSTTNRGGCIQLRSASTSEWYRIYISRYQSSSTPLMVEKGECQQ